MSQSEIIAQPISKTGEDHISKWSMFFLVLLPFLILGSRVSSDVTASFCTVFLAVFWFMNPTHIIRKQNWFKAFFVLWLFMMGTSLLTLNPQDVFIQSLIAIRWPAFALVLVCLVFTSEKRLKIFERSAFAFFIFIVLDSILQYFVGKDIFGQVQPMPTRLTGPFSAMLPGNYAFRIYPMALLTLIFISAKLSKPQFFTLLILMMTTSQVFVFLTGERGPFISFGLMNTALLVALIYKERPSFRFVFGALIGFSAIVLSVVTFAQKMFERTIVSAIHQTADIHNNSYYQMYYAAWKLWETSPWIGVGTRNFTHSCKTLLPDVLKPDEGCEVHPHHIYLEWFVQNGAIGLVLFVLVLFFIFKVLWQNLDFKTNYLQSMVILMSLVVLFFPFTPSMSMQTNNYGGVAWLLVAWALARAMVNGKARVS